MKTISEMVRKFANKMVTAAVDPEITVEVKSQYGSERIYVTSKHKEPIQDLTGSKTLTSYHIKALKALGFAIKDSAGKSY